eukprot:gene8631-17805_t
MSMSNVNVGGLLRWTLVAFLQSSLLGHLVRGLETASVQGGSSGSKNASTMGGAYSLSSMVSWESGLRMVGFRGHLWSDPTLPASRVPPIAICSTAKALDGSESQDIIVTDQLHIRPIWNTKTKAAVRSTTTPCRLYELLALREECPPSEYNLISDWSLFTAYVTDTISQLQGLFDQVFSCPVEEWGRCHCVGSYAEQTDERETLGGVVSLVLNIMHFSGVVLGLALRSGTPAPLTLPDAVWKVLAVSSTTDVKDNDSTYATLTSGNESGFRQETSPSPFERKSQLLSVHGLAAAMALRHGITTVFPESGFGLLTQLDLRNMLCCYRGTSVELLMATATYAEGQGDGGDIFPHDSHVQHFWAAMAECPPSRILDFLCYLWGYEGSVRDKMALNQYSTLLPAPLLIRNNPVPSTHCGVSRHNCDPGLGPDPSTASNCVPVPLPSSDSECVVILVERGSGVIGLPRTTHAGEMCACLQVLLTKIHGTSS